MNVLELQQKLKDYDNRLSFAKILTISFILSLIVFPINYLYNPNIDPIVYENTIWFGMGILVFMMMFMILIVGSLLIPFIVLELYVLTIPKILDSIGKFNTNIISRDEDFLDRMTNGINYRTAKLNKKYDEPKFEELEEKYERFNNERMENEKFYINQNLRLKDKLKTKDKKINKLETQVESLESRVDELEKDKSDKTQKIGDKFRTNNNSENISTKKDNQFEEDL